MMTIMIALAATALPLEEAGRAKVPVQGCKPYFRRMFAGVRPAKAPCFQMAAISLQNNPVIDAQTH